MHWPHGCNVPVGSPWQVEPRRVDVAVLPVQCGQVGVGRLSVTQVKVQCDQVGVEREQVAVAVLVRMLASLVAVNKLI